MCLGSLFGSNDAADAQVDAAKIASQTQLEMFEKMQKLLKPFVDFGTGSLGDFKAALPGLTAPINFTQQQLENLPGYQFTRDQGLEAVQNSAAARGLGSSGPAIAGGAAFAANTANTFFNQAFGNELAQRSQRYNMLMGPVQLGASAAAGQAQGGLQVGSNISQLQMQAGAAKAQGIQSQNSAIDNLLGGALGLLFGL